MNKRYRTEPYGRASFTLIELLLAIGIIGVLAGIVVLAVNPLEQLGSARDAQRQSATRNLQNALYQYMIKNGDFPAVLPECTDGACAIPICRAVAATCVSLSPLVPHFLSEMPMDPSEENIKHTGYTVYMHMGRALVNAPHMGTTSGMMQMAPTDYEARWSMDEEAGATTFADENGSHNGTCTLTTCPQTGLAGAMGLSAQFDNSNDAIVINPTAFDFNANWTVSLWVSNPPPNSYELSKGIFTRTNAGASYWTGKGVSFTNISNPQTVYFVISDGNIITQKSMNTGTGPTYSWTHLAATRNANTVTVYRNGSVVGTLNITGLGDVNGNQNLFIGKGNSGTFNGRIDDVRIYTRALTSAEVLLLASGG